MLAKVGKYEVKQMLGKGATGSVYLAVDPFRQREVAIKVLETLSSDPEQARRQLRFFQNEAALAGKLRHPHIVSILDAGLEDVTQGDPLRYLVMEVVDGPPLTKYCDPAALLDPTLAVEIGYKCCKALEFANTLGVVHRDVKPANILTRGATAGQLEIKVSDFGAAQLARSDVTQVSGVGSPGYMSPEQMKGDEVDFRTDMFSLGGVLYHLLTGARPFNGTTTYELVDSILNSTPPSPSQVRSGVPAALDEVVLRALGKTRDERYSSWDEFAEALARLLGQQRGSQDLSDAEKFSASRRLAFFKRFSDVELWEAVRASRWEQHPAGAVLIQEGTPDEHLFVLASGLLSVTQRGKLLNAVSAGECVGEMAYARRDSQPRSATITAIEPSWAMRMRVQDVDALSESCRARFNEAFLAIMAARLSMLGGRLIAM
ncbi:MAG TPA: serine/threonine-protein kinase [Burkholderiales bacterium]|nr:serine/threonine-protein kinase [Burkholderiales bacterium]